MLLVLFGHHIAVETPNKAVCGKAAVMGQPA